MAPVVDDQNTFNAYATETLDELVRNDQRTQAFMDAITPKVEQLHDAQQQLETVLMHRMEGRLQTLTNAYRTEQVKLHALMDEMDALRAQVRQLSSVVGAAAPAARRAERTRRFARAGPCAISRRRSGARRRLRQHRLRRV